MANLLVLVRHGQSDWNKRNLFTGWKDVGLTEKGEAEAHEAGRLLRAEGLEFDLAFTSVLERARRTLELILGELGQQGLETIEDAALNERDYGDLVGLNKDDARKRWGDEQVHIWRRSFDTRPPGGESLKDTADRVLPYFARTILPEVLAGRRTIVSAHGNSLRALIMQLDELGPDQVTQLNLATGVPIIYHLADDGSVTEKRDLSAGSP